MGSWLVRVVFAVLLGCSRAPERERTPPTPGPPTGAPRVEHAEDPAPAPADPTPPAGPSADHGAAECGSGDPCVLIGDPCGNPIAVPRSQARERSEGMRRIARVVRCTGSRRVSPAYPSCEAGTCRALPHLVEPERHACGRSDECVAVMLGCRESAAMNASAAGPYLDDLPRLQRECRNRVEWDRPPDVVCAFGFCAFAVHVGP